MSRSAPRRRGGWARFVARHGWRAYALPVLAVITVLALVHATGGGAAATHRAAGRHSAAGAAATQVEGDDGGRDNGYQPGATPSPAVFDLQADAPTSCATNSYAQLILVSITRQHLWACDHKQQVDQAPITTGNVVHHDQTPVGSWRVQDKQRDRYLVGPGYKDYVHYWLPFDGDFGLHDAPWQTMPFGSKDWPTGGSHGCVHTPTATMAWIYRWAKVGGTVVTIER